MPSQRQFNRLARLVVGPAGGKGVSIEGLRIEFSVVKTITQTANQIRVTVYNLAENTRSVVSKEGNKVYLYAGYGELQVLAVGDISRAWHAIEPPDRVTHIEAGDGLFSIRGSLTSVSFAEGTSADTVLKEIGKIMGKNLSAKHDLPAASGIDYPQGFAFTGPISEALDKVTDKLGMSWSIQNDQLAIISRDALPQAKIVVLTPRTGLLAAPEPIEDVSADLTGEVVKGCRARCLLQPQLEPGDRVDIMVDGALRPLRIASVEHTGDTRGPQWESVIEASET